MAKGKLIWRGDEVCEKVERSVLRGIADALFDPYVLLLRDAMLAAPSPPASLAGEAPHYGRGESDPDSLVNSIYIWAIPPECKVMVGSESPAALALELGSVSMAARPAWGPTLVTLLNDLGEKVAENSSENFASSSTIYLPENMNLNPLTTETGRIPSSVPSGGASILPSHR